MYDNLHDLQVSLYHIYSTSIVVLYFIGILGFETSLYCVYGFECDV